MESIAYYNGTIGPLEDMRVPMNDRVCFFGDGVYEAACVVRGHVLKLDAHIDRLYRSAALIGIVPKMEKAEMKALLLELSGRVQGEVLLLYWQLTRGTGTRGHAFKNVESGPNLWAFVRPHALHDPSALHRCITVEDRRYGFCHIKTLNLLPNVLASQQAEEAGCDEAIFHRGLWVTECAHSNIHILQDGVLKTAPCDERILPGITRADILTVCQKANIPVREETFTVEEMKGADEVFFSSASAWACRVAEIDGQPVGLRDEETFSKIRDGIAAAYEKEIES